MQLIKMSAPLRIRYPQGLIKKSDIDLKTASEDSTNDTNNYLQRLIKLIPGEAVTMHLTIREMIGNQIEKDPSLKYVPYVGLLVVLIIRVTGSTVKVANNKRDVEWALVLISAISYFLWVIAIGDLFPPMQCPIESPWVGITIMFWTFLIPFLYKPKA